MGKLTKLKVSEILTFLREDINFIIKENNEFQKNIINNYCGRKNNHNVIIKTSNTYCIINKYCYEELNEIKIHIGSHYIFDLVDSNSEVLLNKLVGDFGQSHNSLYSRKNNIYSTVNKLNALKYGISGDLYSYFNPEVPVFEEPIKFEGKEIYFSIEWLTNSVSNNFLRRKKKSDFFNQWHKYYQNNKKNRFSDFGVTPYFPGDKNYNQYKVELDLIIGTKPNSESSGERKIRLFLTKNKIKFKPQQKFKDCFSVVNNRKYKLPFDFFIPNMNILIEYDGRQHFEPTKHFGGDEAFKKRLIRDEIKNTFCEMEKLSLIRIPYTQKENIENILTKNLIKS